MIDVAMQYMRIAAPRQWRFVISLQTVIGITRGGSRGTDGLISTNRPCTDDTT